MTSLTKLQLNDLKNHQPAYLETIFSLANGHFGVRASDPVSPSSSSATLVNGFYESSPISYGESAVGYAKNHQTIVSLPDLRQIEVRDEAGQIFDRSELLSSQLDFESGILKQAYQLANNDDLNITLTLTSVIDQVDQKFIALKYDFVRGSYHGRITVNKPLSFNQVDETSIDPRKARRVKDLEVTKLTDNINQKTLMIKTRNSQLGVTMKLEAVDGQLADWTFDLGHGHGVATYLAGVSNIYSATTSMDFEIDKVNFEHIELDSKNYWHDIWDNSLVSIDGDDQLTQAIRYNLFQLNSSDGRDGKTNVAAKGLSGTGYEGHYFWDTEMYLLPYFTYTNPQIAKDLLDYRFNTLGAAKQQAQTLGVSEGALFPWRTVNGQEASAYYPAGTAQYHIDGDIAYAVNRYYEATSDNQWLAEKGYELILETARFWAGFGHYRTVDGRKLFEFSGVTGPNEYTVMVDNNYYTNRIAKHNLHLAVRLAQVVKRIDPNKLSQLNVTEAELKDFFDIAEAIYLPYNNDLQINAQDDSFFSKPLWPFATTPKENYPLLLHYHPLTIYRHQVAKQADTILAEFLFPGDINKEQLKREYNYYEKITTHDSSLSRSVFSMVAARLSNYKEAYNYFMTTAKMDLIDLQGNTEDGLHLSNLGGSWLALTAGFAGMTFEEGNLHIENHLPKQWRALTFRIELHENLLSIELTHEKVFVDILKGPATKVMINGQWHTIDPREKVEQATG